MKITIQRIDPVDALSELTQFDVRGRRMYIRCPFHDDGDRPENWSMIVHRTHCYCFGCRKSASHYDVINALRSKNGRNVGETAVPVSVNGRRIPTFDELDFVQQTSDLVDDAPMSLAMRPAIATFIERVRDIAAECLLEREDAVDYLRGRMVVDMRRFGYLPSSDRSVASRIDSLSREMGLGDVPMMMGILETNKKDGRMQIGKAFRRSVIAFGMKHRSFDPYFQARFIGGRTRMAYRSPARIRRGPIVFVDDPGRPWLVVEGVFKGAWAFPTFNVFASVGAFSIRPDQESDFADICRRGLICPDNDDAGKRNAESAAMIASEYGFAPRMFLVDDQYKDVDEMALHVGRDAMLRRLLWSL
jgi:hypothetical protein